MQLYVYSGLTLLHVKLQRNTQCGKTRNSLSPKFFREINSLVTSLSKIKTLLSRNFCQKSVRENFRNFHIVTQHTWKNKKRNLFVKTSCNVI